MIPASTPNRPPIPVSTTASVKNWNRILLFLAPMAFFKPISLVRSVTVTSIIFMTPIPPTNREIPAIHNSWLLVAELSSCNCFASSNRSLLLYAKSLSLSTVNLAFKISAVFLPAFVISSVLAARTATDCGSSYR